jgi:hypothetical protein
MITTSCASNQEQATWKPRATRTVTERGVLSSGSGQIRQQAPDLSQIAVKFTSCMLYLPLLVRHVADLISGLILAGNLTIPSSSTASSSPFPFWFNDYGKKKGEDYTSNDNWRPKLAFCHQYDPNLRYRRRRSRRQYIGRSLGRSPTVKAASPCLARDRNLYDCSDS